MDIMLAALLGVVLYLFSGLRAGDRAPFDLQALRYGCCPDAE